MASGSRRQTAFTLVELLVVIVVLALLLAFLLPAMNQVRSPARRASCANNQKQIVLAMLVYANDNDGIWPVRPTDSAGRFENDAGRIPSSFQSTTIGSLEFLVASTGKELTNTVFACPASPRIHPVLGAATNLDQSMATTFVWAAAVAGTAGSTQTPDYCYDWSVPSNARESRVVLADRSLGSVGHKQSVEACFGDGHVSNLRLSLDAVPMSVNPATQTPTWDGNAYVVINPDAQLIASTFATSSHIAIDDNIFDGIGDGPGTGGPLIGAGSATRSWVH